MLRTTSMLFVLLAVCFSAGFQESSAAEIKILAPTEEIPLAAESLHRIRWQADTTLPPQTKLSLYLSFDRGQSWTPLQQLPASQSEYLWEIPNQPGKTCQLRLQTADGKQQSNVSLKIVPSRKVTNYEWKNITMKAPFAFRDGAGALVYQDKMWLLGGWNPRDKTYFPLICNNEVWNSTDGLHWNLIKENTYLDKNFDPMQDWEGRHTAGYTVFQNKMWIVGGDANQGHYQNDVWNSTDGKTWNRLSPQAPPWAPRALHYTLTFKDKIWVIGGQTMPAFAPADEIFYRDLWNSTDGIHWKEVKPEEPCWSARGMIGGNVVFKDRMWILGGGTYDTPTTPKRNFYNDVWSSDDGVHWKQHTAAAPWFPRQYHDVAVFDGRMWVMEGYNGQGGNRKDVWYSDDGVNWYELPNTPWNPRHAASVFVYDDALWMVTGNNFQSDVWKLTRR